MTSILFVFSRPPHGSIDAQEGFDALLMGSAFGECTALFVDQGVLQLLPAQDTDGLGLRNFSMGFAALRDYGVKQVACSRAALERFGITPDELVIDVAVADASGIRQLLNDHDRVLNF